MSLSLKITGINAVGKATKALETDLRKELNSQFKTFGFIVQAAAVAKAPGDDGLLRNSIRTKEGDLSVSVFSTVNYAAYVEFGTRKFAAAYVASLPQDWREYAATFKGKSGGSGDFFANILAWVKRKGIDEKAAYPIAMSILRNGIKAQPFLYPAFRDNIPAFEQRLKNIVK